MPPTPDPAVLRRPRRTDGIEPLRKKRVLPSPAPPRWRRALNYLLIFATVVLLVDALIGEKGFVETMRARRQSGNVVASVERLREENASLRERARRLREDRTMIESVAREDLGLIRPGEVLVILKDLKPASK
jgi:cell division protein FtsB